MLGLKVPEEPLAALFMVEAGGREPREGQPSLCASLLPLLPASSAWAECALGLPPPSTVLGPIQEAAGRMLPTPGSLLGPCLRPFHSPLPPPPPPAPIRLPGTRPAQTSS